MDKVIDQLAEYFTGPVVVHNSIGLSVGGIQYKMAQRFFVVRDALGIVGYDTKEEAIRKIKLKLEL